VRSVVLLVLGLGCWTAACRAPTAPVETALAGTVVRGPIQPVCRIDLACDAPFSAAFTVQQGERVVASFRSDSEGRFEVALARGAYTVVPAQDAPIFSPGDQKKDVVVGASGRTTVTLHFDTGIR
jgi:hypothetical protein